MIDYKETGAELYHDGRQACIQGAAFEENRPQPWQLGWKDAEAWIAELEAGKFTEDATTGMEWCNGMDEANRRYWMRKAGDTGRVIDAWECFKRDGQPRTPVLVSPPNSVR